jgi:hypothetical protein
MKPYGIPRVDDFEFPDLGAINSLGLKSSVGSVPKHGIHRGHHKNKVVKAQVRRFYKRKARAQGKKECVGS